MWTQRVQTFTSMSRCKREAFQVTWSSCETRHGAVRRHTAHRLAVITAKSTCRYTWSDTRANNPSVHLFYSPWSTRREGTTPPLILLQSTYLFSNLISPEFVAALKWTQSTSLWSRILSDIIGAIPAPTRPSWREPSEGARLRIVCKCYLTRVSAGSFSEALK